MLEMITDDHYDPAATSVDLLGVLDACDPERREELARLVCEVSEMELRERDAGEEEEEDREEVQEGKGHEQQQEPPAPAAALLADALATVHVVQLGPTPTVAQISACASILGIPAADLDAAYASLRAELEARMVPLLLRRPYNIPVPPEVAERASRLAPLYRSQCVFGRFATRVPEAVRLSVSAVTQAVQRGDMHAAGAIAAAAAGSARST